MKVFDPIAYQKMVRTYQENDDPLGWFDSIYQEAQGDYSAVFWADLEPSPYLLAWLKKHPIDTKKRAIVIGCGVGDDAEALSAYGYEVIAFDIAPTAIELCKKRFKKTNVTYCVADLFAYPKEWEAAFDVVYECNTIQVLPGKYRVKARQAMSALLCPRGHILVSCRSRKSGEQEDAIPLPLDKCEIDAFVREEGLKELSFYAYDDTQTPSVPHFFALYQKLF